MRPTGILSGTAAWMLLLVLAPTVHAAGAPTAMSGQPCPPARAGDAGGSAFLRMILTPGAHFIWHRPTAKERRANEHAAAGQEVADWANLCRYRAADATLPRPPRVVLMGDSISDFWRQGDPSLFAGGAVVDRGISGQTSPQMLVRFWPDVIALHPRMVQILAGTNDIAGNTGPTTEADFEHNIMAMVELAQVHHIRVLLGSIPPAVSFWWAPARYRPAHEIRRLNDWLRHYAHANGLGFIDYYAHLSTPSGAFRPELSNDGVHPNRAGYEVMTRLLGARIGAE